MADELKSNCSICADILSKIPIIDIDKPDITIEEWVHARIREELIIALNNLHRNWGTPPYEKHHDEPRVEKEFDKRIQNGNRLDYIIIDEVK